MSFWSRLFRRQSAPPAPPGRRPWRNLVRSFAGAVADRLTADWTTSVTGVNDELERGLRKLRERARAIVRDTPTGARIAQLHALHVAGPDGVALEVDLRSTRGRPRTSTNDAIEWAWWEWSRRGNCTTDRVLSLTDVQRLAAMALVGDGEFLALHVVANREYRVRVLDPDQLDLTFNGVATETGNRVVMGVELSASGSVVAYHIWDGHPSSKTRGRRRRYDAQDVVHWFVADRPGQLRGIPRLTPSLLAARHLDAYVTAAVVAARAGAAKVTYLVQDEDSGGEPLGPDGVELALTEEVEPGTRALLPPGVRPEAVDPTYPHGEFASFEKALTRRIAVGAGLSYASVSGDLESVNYSSIRAGLLDERDHWRALQRGLIDAVLDPIFRRWLAVAYAANRLAGAGALDLAAVVRATTWRARGWSWVDPLKDVQALEAEIRLGLNTRTAAAAERGREFTTMLQQLATEMGDAEELGVPIAGSTPAALAPRSDDKENDDGQDDGAGTAGGDTSPDDDAVRAGPGPTPARVRRLRRAV